MRAFSKFLIHKFVLPRQRLYVFRQFGHFLGLQLAKLSLLVKLLSEAFKFLSEGLDFLLTREQISLIVVFFADNQAHLVLNIAKFKALLL